MEKVLLNPKELQELQELYGYEITQIMLEHNAMHPNGIGLQLLESVGLTMEDISKIYEYTPVVETEINMKSLDVPDVEVSATYTPLTEVDVVIKHADGVQSALKIESLADYIPLEEVNVNIVTPEVPETKLSAEFKPVEIEKVEIATPEMSAPVDIKKHKPLKEIAIKVSEVDIPEIAPPLSFTPIEPQVSTEVNIDEPVVNNNFTYAPHETQSEVEAVECPIISGIKGYKPRKIKSKLKAIKCPVVGSAAAFIPIETADVTPTEVSLPDNLSTFAYNPLMSSDKSLPKIDAPAFGNIAEYKPVESSSIDKAKIPTLPEYNVSIEYSSVKDIEITTQEPELPFSTEDVISKDFYEIWLNQ